MNVDPFFNELCDSQKVNFLMTQQFF